MKQEKYSSVSVFELLRRGRFLTSNYLSRDELKLGLAYLKSAAARGSLDAAKELIHAAETHWLDMEAYDAVIRDAAYDAIPHCRYAEEGIDFVEKLVTYGSAAETLSALAELRSKPMESDSAVTRVRMMIVEYQVTGKDPEEMLAACRENLDCFQIYRFYYDYFSVRPKSRKHFDHITPEDAKLLYSACYKRNEDPEALSAMIRDSESPHRFTILENHKREEEIRREKSRQLNELYEKEMELMDDRFFIRHLVITLPDDLFEEEETHEHL